MQSLSHARLFSCNMSHLMVHLFAGDSATTMLFIHGCIVNGQRNVRMPQIHRPLAVVNHEVNVGREMCVGGHVSRRVQQNDIYTPDGNHFLLGNSYSTEMILRTANKSNM
jgi:hypothetical protein